MKLAILKFNQNDFSIFPRLNSFYEENEQSLHETFIDWLESLSGDFDKRFADFQEIKPLIIFGNDPSKVEPKDATELAQITGISETELQMDIVKYNSELSLAKGDNDLNILKRFKFLAKAYSIAISIFPNSYNCESSFSKLNFILNEYRSSLTNDNASDCLLTACSDLELDFKKIIKKFDCKIFFE